MSTDAINEINKAFNDLDAHKKFPEIEKFVPRGSQEFRKALLECRQDDDFTPQTRERSSTIDTTYKKPHPSVHFASNLVTICAKKNKSKDDIHTHLHPDGILRHGRERSNTYDGTVQRPRRATNVKSPLCNDTTTTPSDTDSAVEKLLKQSPEARKIDSEVHPKENSDGNNSSQFVRDKKSLSSTPQVTKNGYNSHTVNDHRKSGTSSPSDKSLKGSSLKK